MSDDLNDLTERLIRIEAKLDMLATQMAGQQRQSTTEPSASNTDVLGLFTPKQHVAIQMMMAGEKNASIAKVLGITENTAKVHVRTVAKKLGVKTRGQIVAKLMSAMEAVPGPEYLAMASIPKDWWETKPKGRDKYAKVYRS